MKYTTTVDAVQLNEQDAVFEGQPVKGFYFTEIGGKMEKIFETEVFANVPYQSGSLKVSKGQWLVSYPDGVKEVYNDEVFKSDFVEVPEVAEEKPTAKKK